MSTRQKNLLILSVIGVFLFIQPLSAQTWTAAKRLTWSSGSSMFPAIAADSNNHIYVVWEDNASGNWEIYSKKSVDGGASWTTKRLTYNSSGSANSAIAIDSNNYVYVAWLDWAPGNAEIHYKRSTNGGNSWNTKRLTWTSGYSWNPALTADSNNHIHVVWYDDTPGVEEIHYKKGIQ